MPSSAASIWATTSACRVYVSGTVGAAREATFLHKPGIAVSAEKQTPHDTLEYLSDWAVEMAEKLVTRGAPELTVCNLNAPPIPCAELKSQVLCPLNRAGYRDSYEQLHQSAQADVLLALPSEARSTAAGQ